MLFIKDLNEERSLLKTEKEEKKETAFKIRWEVYCEAQWEGNSVAYDLHPFLKIVFTYF